MKIWFLIMLVTLAGCTDSPQSTEAPSAVGATLISSVSALPGPHQYEVRIRWTGISVLGYHLFRSDESKEVVKLYSIVSPTGEFIDANVSDGKNYKYSLGVNSSDEIAISSVLVPKDFDTRDPRTETGWYLAGYNRVFVHKIVGNAPVTIKANEIIAVNGVIDASSPQEAQSEVGANGQNGKPILLIAERLKGTLELLSFGQPGGAVNGEGKVGIRGAGGNINVKITERSSFILNIRVKSTPTDVRDFRTGYAGSRVYIAYADRPDFGFFPARISDLSPPLDGLWQIGTELYYLSPGNALLKLEPREDGIVFNTLNVSSSWGEGVAIEYNSDDSSRAPGIRFGLRIQDSNRFGTYVLRNETSGELKAFWRFGAKLTDLSKEFQRAGTSIYVSADNDQELKVSEIIPSELIDLMTDEALPIMRAFQENRITGIQFHLSKEPKLEKREPFLLVSGPVNRTLEEILEVVRAK